MFRILVLEDDLELNKTVCAYLRQNFYEVSGCTSAYDAYQELYRKNHNLIITDIMMPDIDGYEFVRTIRERNAEIPILFMTAKDDIESKKRGFRLGVDDYMVKPIDLEELLLHIEAILRRAGLVAKKRLEIGDLSLDVEEHTAYVNGEEVLVTVREFDLLYKLLSNPKKTFTRTQLMDEFWDVETESSPRVVDVYIRKIRDKFSKCKDFEIVTVHGLGYKGVIK
ncbi:MAG: response regulator transcription factor [Lachnospiraceae bacterium]|nr:response regulator transcription factor [Lachnospiraceae bacterium]